MHTAAQVKPTKPATPFQQQPASSTVSATADSFSSAESTATPTTAPMIEGSQNEETASQLATKWEQRLFGYAHTNDSMDKRLSRIERNVYGAVKQGTDQARVDMLKAALDIKDEPISSLSTETPIVSQTRTTTDSDDCSCEKGNAYYAKGDYKNAAFYYHKAAVNMAKEWGTNNANVANMKHSEGLCYYNMSQYQHADALLNESLQIYKRSAASHKTDLALVYWTLANSATETRSWDKAVSAYTSAISYYKILKPSKNYADCLAAFASCYQRRGWIQKSHELRAQSQEVLRRAVIEKGPSEKDTIDIS
ncbi:MAG TPA: tetratricopeptide repeat protein [Planktothrix sp.]|jgi:tetratricopeptide (TPR) repeat protein